MIRNYNITWYPTRDGEDFKRETFVKLSKPTGTTSIDAKTALGIFMKTFGNLNKNTIVAIKEFGENGQIGEDIIPSDDNNAIVPIGR